MTTRGPDGRPRPREGWSRYLANAVWFYALMVTFGVSATELSKRVHTDWYYLPLIASSVLLYGMTRGPEC